MRVLVVPSSWIVAVTLLQFSELTLLVFCRRIQSIKGDGQETVTLWVVERKMLNYGASA